MNRLFNNKSSQSEEYIHIKQDLIGYTYMNHIMELVRSTISDDLNHEKMYVFLQKLFRMMNNGYDPEILTFIFELKLMFFLGTGLHLQACSVCGKTEHLCFHISSGGLICKDHLEAFELVYDETVYREIQTLYYIDIEEDAFPIIDSNTRVIIRHIIDLLFSEFIGFSTKSREILKQIKKY